MLCRTGLAIRFHMISAARLAACLTGESPVGVNCPVGTVEILGDGEGDQSGGSPSVKAYVDPERRAEPYRRRASTQVVAKAN